MLCEIKTHLTIAPAYLILKLGRTEVWVLAAAIETLLGCSLTQARMPASFQVVSDSNSSFHNTAEVHAKAACDGSRGCIAVATGGKTGLRPKLFKK